MSLNDVTVKEELAQLSDIFKLIEDINQKMIELDDKDIDEKMFSFKRKVCNRLKEGDKIQKREKKNKIIMFQIYSSSSISSSF